MTSCRHNDKNNVNENHLSLSGAMSIHAKDSSECSASVAGGMDVELIKRVIRGVLAPGELSIIVVFTRFAFAYTLMSLRMHTRSKHPSHALSMLRSVPAGDTRR